MTAHIDVDADFADFVGRESRRLLRAAWLLTHDWARAEDLVQSALLTTWQRWDRITRRDAPQLYVRQVMLRTWLAWQRRRAAGEIVSATLPERGVDDPSAELRADVLAALAALSPRQRAVVVLLYFEDLDHADAARVLGCTVGTVKQHSSRALAKLRISPGLADLGRERS